MKRSGQASKTVVALLAVVLVLGASTAYLAFVVMQPKPSGGSLPGQVSQALQSYPVVTVDPGTVTASSANSITVSATGVASYIPNEALVVVSVSTENATAEAATRANARTMTGVIGALGAIGISNGSMQTQGYSLSVDYASCYSSCVPSIIGYTVSNSLQVNFTSGVPATLGVKAGEIIDTAVKAGANGVSLYFAATQSVLDQLTNRALTAAVASADSQAQTIAASLGVSITGVISASEGTSYYPQAYYAYPVASLVSSASSAGTITPIVPGTQSISATVQVVYSI